MEDEIQKLKSVLRSLVVSSPTQVDLRSLLRDYRSMMGEHLPVSKYGYRDPMAFLKERCNDCFLFGGPPSNPVLTLIVPDSLKHIDKFVRKQKTSTTAKFKGKRQSVPKENLIVNTFNNKRSILEKPKPEPLLAHSNNYKKVTPTVEITKPPTHNIEKQMVELNLNEDENIVDDVSEKQCKDSNYGSLSEKQESKNSNYCSKEALLSFMKKRIPVYDEDSAWGNEGNNMTSSQDDDSGRRTSSSLSSSKLAKLDVLKSEIHELIAENPDGVWCTDLIGLYRDRYNKELNFTRFGYTSIISLVYALDSVHVIRPHDTGDWLLGLTPAPPPHPLTVSNLSLPSLPSPVRHRSSSRRLQVDPEDALPGIQFDPDVFPSDCLHYMESVPPPRVQAEAGSSLEVVVGEVYSPSHAWLIRLGEQHNIAMENIMDEMNEYYGSGEGAARSLAAGAVRVGHYVAALYDRHWHRAIIVQILDADTVKVRHVDYGTVTRTLVSSLRPLRRVWAGLEAQGVRARLAGVRPASRGRRWARPAAAHFLQLVQDVQLVAQVAAVDHQEGILEVFLIDTSGADDVCISTAMIRSGHADPRPDSALTTAHTYLYPAFDALESGATPNYEEIYQYLRDGIDLNYVESYRRHVPVDRLATPPPQHIPDPPSEQYSTPDDPSAEYSAPDYPAQDYPSGHYPTPDYPTPECPSLQYSSPDYSNPQYSSSHYHTPDYHTTQNPSANCPTPGYLHTHYPSSHYHSTHYPTPQHHYSHYTSSDGRAPQYPSSHYASPYHPPHYPTHYPLPPATMRNIKPPPGFEHRA